MTKLLLFILFYIGGTSIIQAQTTAIPDAAFEQKLVQLGIDSDGLVNGQILNSDAASVIRMDVSSSNISDMTGLTAFSNLKALTCHSNNLTTLDLSGCPDLDFLRCLNNQFATLDLSNNPSLDTLYCSDNNIDSIDFSSNPTLVWMECTRNSIDSLDFSNNPLIQRIRCGDNEISHLNLPNNPLLFDFVCSDNQLDTLHLDSVPALSIFSCRHNNLSNLEVPNSPNMWLMNCNNNQLSSLDVSNCLVLNSFHFHNNQLSSVDLSNLSNLSNLSCQNNLPNLIVCIHPLQSTTGWSQDPTTVYLTDCYPLAVNGRIAIDTNINCIADSIENGLENIMVRFERQSDNSVYIFSTIDTLGNYNAYLDTGTYVTSVVLNNNYWQACPSSQTVVINTSYNLQTIDWALQVNVICPFLEVDIAAPFLRMTGGGSAYSVSYCNTGTLAASNAYIEVDVDPNLTVLGTTWPIANQTGTLYTFNVGTINPDECGTFDIQVIVDTSALFQQTHCTEAHIYPDSICSPIWNGPWIDGFVKCLNDTVHFILLNKGSAMLSPQPYTIFEDNIAMRIGTVNLGAGQTTAILQSAIAGKTYRIEISQATGFPPVLGNLIFSKAIEGCNPLPNGNFNVGFITQFSNGSSAPFMAIDCQQNVASYDPNDKSAQPVGYGSQHYIAQNIGLDYKIRFQNTGTDTAFNIVIVDTLSSNLDLTTLQMGASSHAYTWAIEAGNALKVTFPLIMLVDSNANEPLSHGFFRYRIEQQLNNPIGSEIKNQAGIYFDYNPPIFTNETVHLVGENFVTTIIVSVDNIYAEDLNVTVYPNPFESETTIQIEGSQVYEQLELTIFNLSGQQVKTVETSASNQIQLSRERLETGMYIYQLKGDGMLLSTGKVVVR